MVVGSRGGSQWDSAMRAVQIILGDDPDAAPTFDDVLVAMRDPENERRTPTTNNIQNMMVAIMVHGGWLGSGFPNRPWAPKSSHLAMARQSAGKAS